MHPHKDVTTLVQDELEGGSQYGYSSQTRIKIRQSDVLNFVVAGPVSRDFGSDLREGTTGSSRFRARYR